MNLNKFVHKLQQEKRRRGVYAAARTLRRQGISLETALVLLVRK